MLHSAHLEGHFQHVHTAGEDAAKLLSRDFQTHARSHGLPEELVQNLHVRYDTMTGEFRPGAFNAAHREALDDYEYGNFEHAPMGIIASFNAKYESKAMDYYSHSMLSRMSGAF